MDRRIDRLQSASDQLVANRGSLNASKLTTAPPTRFVV
jgi:hypothetical protein